MDITQVQRWLFYFFIFTMIGWIQESIIESLYHKKLINRGFLKGPYIPIYGFGGCLMLIVCVPFSFNPFLVFLVGMVSCTALEFCTGMIMEKAFNKQFWDYSMFKLTIKNRISLVVSIFWGALSLFMVYVLNGLMNSLFTWMDSVAAWVYIGIMFVLMTLDFIVSARKNYKEKLAAQKNDEPESSLKA